MSNQQGYLPGMPKILADQRRAGQQRYKPELDAKELTFADSMYDYLWPVTFWGLTLFNIGIMIGTLTSLVFRYEWLPHLEAAAITVASTAALALIYKKILKAVPAEVRYYVEQVPFETAPPPQT